VLSTSPLQSKTTKVACIGDSITEAYGYPEQLQNLLGSTYIVLNFGISGSTVSLDSETPYMLNPIFWKAKTSEPDIVIIMLGTNDAQSSLEEYIGNFANDYVDLIRNFQNLPNKPGIWLVKPPPIFGDGNGLSSQRLEREILPKIIAVANEIGVPLIDIYSLFVNQRDCFPNDGVHPNDIAVHMIAKEIYRVIMLK
jgi:acyl-CoA thioesterase I